MIPYQIGKTCEVFETSQVFYSSYGTTTGQAVAPLEVQLTRP